MEWFQPFHLYVVPTIVLYCTAWRGTIKKRARVGENTVEQNTLAVLEAPNHVGATAKLAAGSGGMRRVAKEYTDDVDGDEDLRIVDDDVGTGRQGRNLFTLGYGREQRPNICF